MLARACMWLPGRVDMCMRIRAYSLANPARNAYAPCDIICGSPCLHYIFRHYLINGAIFEKKLLNIKCAFIFSLQLLSKTFLILRRIKRNIVKNIETSSRKLSLFLSDFNKIWIFSTDFRGSLKYQVSLKSVQWKRNCSMRTGRHDETTNIRFSQFCERGTAVKQLPTACNQVFWVSDSIPFGWCQNYCLTNIHNEFR
jgi:hypothetical protein